VLEGVRAAVGAEALSIIWVARHHILHAPLDALSAKHVPALGDDTDRPRRVVQAYRALRVDLALLQPLHNRRRQCYHGRAPRRFAVDVALPYAKKLRKLLAVILHEEALLGV